MSRRTAYITVVAGWFAIAGVINAWLAVQMLQHPEGVELVTRLKVVVMTLGGPLVAWGLWRMRAWARWAVLAWSYGILVNVFVEGLNLLGRGVAPDVAGGMGMVTIGGVCLWNLYYFHRRSARQLFTGVAKGMTQVILVMSLVGLDPAGTWAVERVQLDAGAVPEKLRKTEQAVLAEDKKLEEFLTQRGAFFEDPELLAYLDEVGQKMVPAHDDPNVQVRFKIIRDPTLNAFANYRGLIFVTTGLLARLRNEAQLAAVLGHEVSHVMHRDLLYYMDQLHGKTVSAKVWDLILSPATAVVGAPTIGSGLVGLIFASSVTGFSREQEAQADREGLERMRQAGYEPIEALRSLHLFVKEVQQYRDELQITFLMSHPTNRQRITALKKLLNLETVPEAILTQDTADETFLHRMDRLRLENVALFLKLGWYQHAIEDLRAFFRRHPQHPQAEYLWGEAYRLIADNRNYLKDELASREWIKVKRHPEAKQRTEWRAMAQAAYERAIELDPQFAEPHRGLGLLLLAQAEHAPAKRHLEQYLTLAPQAKDRRFVTSKIKSIDQLQAQAGPSAHATIRKETK